MSRAEDGTPRPDDSAQSAGDAAEKVYQMKACPSCGAAVSVDEIKCWMCGFDSLRKDSLRSHCLRKHDMAEEAFKEEFEKRRGPGQGRKKRGGQM